MKIIHLTDTHLTTQDQDLFGLRPVERLRLCLASIKQDHRDADLVVITGDLTDHGTQEEYRLLRETLAVLDIPVRLLLGNHDERSAFRAIFPDHFVDPAGFVQSGLEIDETLLVFLDSKDGKGSGRLCCARYQAVADILSASTAREIVVFIHHPVLSVGVRHFHGMELDNAEELVTLFCNDGRVRHILCGHVHLPVTVVERGLVQTSGRGVAHHVVLDLAARDARFSAFEPSYNVLLVSNGRLTVHTMDFLDNTPVLSRSRGRALPGETDEAA